MKTAILFGAGGNIGGHLLGLLLDSNYYDNVKIVTRREPDVRHPYKLTALHGDYETLPRLKEELAADDVFVIIGATEPEVERNYPVIIARLCREMGARSFSIVTSVGANPRSRLAFTRVKGEIERDILGMDFGATHIFRPGMIMGARDFYRPMERATMRLWRVIDPLMVGRLSKFRGMEARDIALAMYLATTSPDDRTTGIYHWKEMKNLCLKFTTVQ
jgi:uncharacterized protein YbjT (DUF2867 family)